MALGPPNFNKTETNDPHKSGSTTKLPTPTSQSSEATKFTSSVLVVDATSACGGLAVQLLRARAPLAEITACVSHRAEPLARLLGRAESTENILIGY